MLRAQPYQGFRLWLDRAGATESAPPAPNPPLEGPGPGPSIRTAGSPGSACRSGAQRSGSLGRPSRMRTVRSLVERLHVGAVDTHGVDRRVAAQAARKGDRSPIGKAAIANGADGTLTMTNTAVGAGTTQTVSVPIAAMDFVWTPGGT